MVVTVGMRSVYEVDATQSTFDILLLVFYVRERENLDGEREGGEAGHDRIIIRDMNKTLSTFHTLYNFISQYALHIFIPTIYDNRSHKCTECQYPITAIDYNIVVSYVIPI